MITFDAVPSSIRTPFVAVEFSPDQSRAGVALKPLKTLLIGGRRSSGAVAQNIATRVTNADEVGAAFGYGSTAHNLAQAYFGAGGNYVETWAIAVDDDGAGVAATKTITVAGSQTEAGTIYLYIAGRRLTIAVGSNPATDTSTVIAARIVTAVTAAVDLPYTAANAAGVVTLTAKNKGETGNDIDVRLNYNSGEKLPAGLTATIAAGTTGATNPSIASVFAAIGDEQFDVMACAFDDATNFSALDAELESRWGPTRPIDGVAFIGKKGTFGTLTAFGGARNSKHICVMGQKNAPASPLEFAGATAGVAARYGQQDPARPFQTLELTGLLAPALADRWTFTELNQLLNDGISTFTVNASGRCAVGRLITTYQTSPAGAADTAFLDVTTRLTLSFLRYSFRTAFAARYPRAKLSRDEAFAGIGGQVVTPSIARAECIAIFMGWQELGLVEDLEAFKAGLKVEIDAQDGNRLNIVLPPDLIGQLIVTAAKIAFRL